MRVVVRILAALLLAACYPAPTQKESAWSGTVLANEEPVPGAKVTLVRRGAETVTRTDSLGRFQFAGARGWTVKWLIRVTHIDCSEEWSVEVEREAGSSRIVAVSGMGPCTPPEVIRMTCDYAREGVFCEVSEPARLNDKLKELRVLWAPAGAQPSPALEVAGGSIRLVLPSPVTEALEAGYPGLHLWQPADFPPRARDPDNFDPRQAMSVVVADLNGDGADDVALTGRVGETVSVVLALLSGADAAVEVAEIRRDTLRRPVGAGTGTWMDPYLTLVPPGHYEASCRGEGERPTLDLDHAALAVVLTDRARTIVHYEDGSFRDFHWRGC